MYIPYSPTVRIADFQSASPGSIPGVGKGRDDVPEWLTGYLAKVLGFARAGSNPVIITYGSLV